MNGKGNCYDNAMVETVFKTIKSDLIWRTVFQARKEVIMAIGEDIEGFYNPVRRHWVVLQRFDLNGARLNSERSYAASASNCCLIESAF